MISHIIDAWRGVTKLAIDNFFMPIFLSIKMIRTLSDFYKNIGKMTNKNFYISNHFKLL